MLAIPLIPDVYWVGAVDWNLRQFHGHEFATGRGSSYNAYLIKDEKTALVDTVYAPLTEELIERIRAVLPPEKIDYIIANHVETDHSGALAAVVKLCPKAKVFGTAKCKEGLQKHYYLNLDFNVVKTGDELKLGRKTLRFIEAPMLHWPDSMFTYLVEDQILLPNDAFGQHYAAASRFDDEVDEAVLMDEAKKYYASILWPLGTIVARKIDELKKMNIPIKMIAPSHGIIWRKGVSKIIDSYLYWANNQTINKAVIVYETMWNATAAMAGRIADGIIAGGVGVQVFDINAHSPADILKEMLDARGFVIGSSTEHMTMLPDVAGFLEFLGKLKPKNRLACAFGSYGWGGGAVQAIEKKLQEAKIELAQPGLAMQYVPDANEAERCFQYGKNFASVIARSVATKQSQ